jgi:hypothetical protein
MISLGGATPPLLPAYNLYLASALLDARGTEGVYVGICVFRLTVRSSVTRYQIRTHCTASETGGYVEAQ